MSTIAQLNPEQDGVITLHPVQHLRHRLHTGSSTTIGSRAKAGILGEPHPGWNSILRSWQSTGGVDRHTFRAPHFLMDNRCTVTSRITRGSRVQRLEHMIGVHLCVPHETLHPLRAMSYTLQHSTPCTGTPSSPHLVQRSEQHCHDPRPQQRGTSADLPPPAQQDTNNTPTPKATLILRVEMSHAKKRVF